MEAISVVHRRMQYSWPFTLDLKYDVPLSDLTVSDMRDRVD